MGIFATPKSSIWVGFSIINHPFWGTSMYGNHETLHSQCHASFGIRRAKVQSPGPRNWAPLRDKLSSLDHKKMGGKWVDWMDFDWDTT